MLGILPRLCSRASLWEIAMSRVRVHNFSVSLDGFGTGEGQGLDAPFGHAGDRLQQWFFGTRTFHAMHGRPGGSTGVDDACASNWGPGIGAEIMGGTSSARSAAPGWARSGKAGGETTRCSTPRSSCSPAIPGPRLRWRAAPPSISSTPARPGLWPRRARPREGGTSASAAARRSSASSWPPALVDHLHIVVVPIVPGRGERLWDGLEGFEHRLGREAVSSPSGASHLTFTRR